MSKNKDETIKLLDKAPLEEVVRIKAKCLAENQMLEYLFLDNYIKNRLNNTASCGVEL